MPEDFGMIESAVLVVFDENSKQLCRAVLQPQKMESKKHGTLEFNLRPEFLKHSYVVVSHRKGDDLEYAKFILSAPSTSTSLPTQIGWFRGTRI